MCFIIVPSTAVKLSKYKSYEVFGLGPMVRLRPRFLTILVCRVPATVDPKGRGVVGLLGVGLKRQCHWPKTVRSLTDHHYKNSHSVC